MKIDKELFENSLLSLFNNCFSLYLFCLSALVKGIFILIIYIITSFFNIKKYNIFNKKAFNY